MTKEEKINPALELIKKEFDEFYIGGSILQHDRNKIWDFFYEQFKLRENQSYWRSQFSVIQTEHHELSAKISHLEALVVAADEILIALKKCNVSSTTSKDHYDTLRAKEMNYNFIRESKYTPKPPESVPSSKQATSEGEEFADFLLGDFEMDTFDDGQTLCWKLAGTNQKYTSKQIYEIFLKTL